MDLRIVESDCKDKEFILHANKEIDKVSNISKSCLSQNVDEDLLKNKRAICLIAKDGDKPVGMVLFSKVYWADRGEGVYVSQAFVEEKYRNKGVFKKLLQSAFDFFSNTKFVTLLVAKDNFPMQKCVFGLGFEIEDMMSFVLNKNDFVK